MPRTGLKVSGYDGRDLTWNGPVASGSAISLNVPFGPRDQGTANCCVGVAVVTAMETLDALRGGSKRLSPLFNYFVSRSNPQHTGNVGIRDGLTAAVRLGVCRSEAYESNAGPDGPYQRADALLVPDESAYADARSNRVLAEDPNRNSLGYYRLKAPGMVGAWMSALEQSSPVIFGFFTTEAYQRLSGDGPYEVRDTSRDSGSSGHAAVAVGYDGAWFRVRDSRGSNFANHGEWRLHSSVVEQAWVQESWAVAAIGYDT